MVAFDSSVTCNVRSAGGWKQTLFSGEGLVCDFYGPGHLYIQSHSEQSCLNWLIPKLPKGN